ncbi:MAG: BrnA antitoxin family protein [Pseudomonadota bacterium]
MARKRSVAPLWAKHPGDMTIKERVSWMRSLEGMRQLEYDLHDTFNFNETFPREWFEIWQGEDRDTKTVRMTIRVDADVVRFFKSMGPGYQPRMNKVLRSFMHARLAKFIDGPMCAWEVLEPKRTLDEEVRSVIRK